MKSSRVLILAAGVAVAVYWASTGGIESQPGPASAPAPGGQVRVVDTRPDVAGYDRDCGARHSCVFGPAWSDDVDVDGGHNGCDTRNDILARDLDELVVQPGTRGCLVLAGELHDPYTGATVSFDRAADPAGIQIDHVFALAAAWDHGASTWTPQRRLDFANDPANLVATIGRVNQSKGDQTPQDWMPAHAPCRYANAYLRVARLYALTITTSDQRALDHARSSC
jgi:hypothetical protein